MTGRDSIEHVGVSIAQERCTHALHKASTCMHCSEACPSGALTLSSNRPLYTASLCMKCGACASVCPMDAIEVQAPSAQKLEEEITTNAVLHKKIIFTCKEVGVKREDSIALPCLARLEPSLLLLALEKGALEIQLISKECQKCALKQNQPLMYQTIEMTQKYADFLNVPIIFKSVQNVLKKSSYEDDHFTCKDHSRRTLFLKLLGKKSVESSWNEATITYENIKNGTKMELPTKHQRLIQSLQRLAKWAPLVSTLDPFVLTPTLDALQCIGCTLCANVCPTGALEADTNEDGLKITCKNSVCVACHLCVDICFKHAITLDSDTTLDTLLSAQRVLLYEREKIDDSASTVSHKMSALLGTKIYST